MDGKLYQNALYGRMVNCLNDKGQLDNFMVSLQNCIDIVWELAKIAKEEEYPEYFHDRVLDLLEAYNIDYRHLGEDKDDKELISAIIELNEMLDLIHTELVDLNFNMTHYWEDKDNDKSNK